MTVLGIDLGTTHSALAYRAEGELLRVLEVPQLSGPGTIEARPLLASFLYLPNAAEFAPGALALPWSADVREVVGEYARSRGSEAPMGLVASAKSWLCHPGVDRRAALLPLAASGSSSAPNDVPRVSPVEASARYLAHLRAAFEHAHPGALATADVVLTVPASFDPAARELTLEAAALAGFGEVTLLEEPQAALYSWIERTGDAWREHVAVGDVILVVDVGGGTTDLSLIAVEEEHGVLAPRRLAVGSHILLGGDNMDLTLAHVVRAKLEGQGVGLDDWQMRSLVLACRGAKERLLGDEMGEIDTIPLVIPSRGSSLIGGSIRTEVTAFDAIRVLLDGFFPDVAIADAPEVRPRAGVTELGLPYAQDPAVTRHLAAFLTQHRGALPGSGDAGSGGHAFARPTRVLFNGGVFKSPELRARTLGTLNRWLKECGATEARELPGGDLDLACARGAAHYAEARKGRGVRIRGGTARAYYVGVEAAVPAVPGFAPPVHGLCVSPFGVEEGSDWRELNDAFGLVVGETVRFRFFGSGVRREDTLGTRVTAWKPGELEELPGLELKLDSPSRTAGEVVPVRFAARVSEVGALEIRARVVNGSAADGGVKDNSEQDNREQWKLSFDLRGTRASAPPPR
jgi:hypothetical protein